jgi:hypothetical protein
MYYILDRALVVKAVLQPLLLAQTAVSHMYAILKIQLHPMYCCNRLLLKLAEARLVQELLLARLVLHRQYPQYQLALVLDCLM